MWIKKLRKPKENKKILILSYPKKMIKKKSPCKLTS